MSEHWHIVNTGQIQIATTPEQLWEHAVSYFKWCEDNPIVSKRTLTSGKTQGAKIDVEYVRPYTIKAFCIHAGVSERWINDLKIMEAPESEWVMVIEKILYIIYTQNLEGGLVDLYNPIMVSKVLNMDKENEGEKEVAPRVEIIDNGEKRLATSENEILETLDFGKVEQLKVKVENIKEQNLER